MGNRPSLSLRKRAKKPSAAPSAALPAVASGLAAAEQQQQVTALRLSSSVGISTARPELLDEKARETPREDASEDRIVSNQTDDQDDKDGEEEEDPLQFFRRLSSLSDGGGERGSQDLFMSYTQALLLKQGGDYAAASTLLRLVRHYKSLETEAHFHLAQCLLQLDPELRCFSDEIVACLEKVLSSSTRGPTYDDSMEDAAAWHQMKRESTELLAHVLVAQGQVERARDLFTKPRAASEQACGNNSDNQYEEQQSVQSFQLAYCELALGDLEAAHEQLQSVDCRRTLALAHVDAQAMRLVMERAGANEALSRDKEVKSGGFAA